MRNMARKHYKIVELRKWYYPCIERMVIFFIICVFKHCLKAKHVAYIC